MKNTLCYLLFVIFSTCSMAFANIGPKPAHQSQYEPSAQKQPLEPNFSPVEHTMAKSVSGWKPKHVKTSSVSYETVNGVLVHVAWYQDAYIATALNGTAQWKQIIGRAVDDNIMAVSYDCEKKGDCLIHKYVWGKVYTYSNKQEVKPNK